VEVVSTTPDGANAELVFLAPHPPAWLALDADGDRLAFDLPLAPAGTAYQRRVWQALCDIPPGVTRTYADIARAVGGSPRAVGGANGRNPIPIVIPCHRVVATTGIGGYSGGDGPATKRYLLDHESRALLLPLNI
jgi:methylated-DNA-[protein]-cysteine S-methyltransferase